MRVKVVELYSLNKCFYSVCLKLYFAFTALIFHQQEILKLTTRCSWSY